MFQRSHISERLELQRVDSRRDERVFLVRMWLERSTPRNAWRGSIQDVGSGRKFYLTGPGEIADFITVRLDEDGAAEGAS